MKTPQTLKLPPLRIGLDVGLPAISIFDGERWVMRPCLDAGQGLRFARALGYEVPPDARERIRAGQIVELERKPRRRPAASRRASRSA